MGLFSRKKKGPATNGVGSGGAATVRHRDTGMIVMNVDQVLPIGRQVVVSGIVQIPMSVGDWVTVERGGSAEQLQLKKVDSGRQLGDQATAGQQAGLLFEPRPSVVRWLLDASL